MNASPRRLGKLCAVLLGGLGLVWTDRVLSQEEFPPVAPLEEFSRAFRDAYQQVRPAVVLISTTRQWRFVRRLLPPAHPDVPEEELGLGSGVIVRQDGYILSNYHVVARADSILVTLADRRTFQAQVVGFDSLIDIALLKIQAQDLPTVRLGDSDLLQIGDWVLAIGHPLGLGSTLTHGIVSALGRQAGIFEGEHYAIESFIQTNAVINPGNSGGPLLDLQGQVVGINTAIATRTRYFIGYGLAVPINLAREAMNDLLVYGRVVRGYLGVGMKEVTQELIQEQGLLLERPQGVYVEILPDSPAARGGLQDGDVVLDVEGVAVDHPNQIQTLIYGRDPGERVRLTVLRRDLRREMEIELGEREEERLLAQGQQRVSSLGLAVQSLPAEMAARLGFTREIAAELGFAEGETPLVVVQVEPDGPAAAKGIQLHDVITEIDQQRITSVEQFVRFLSALEQGKSALFWFWRPERGIDVRALRIPE
jgi:serine protease Do